MLIAGFALNALHFQWWWLLPTIIFMANDTKQALRIPDRDKTDVALAGTLVGQELFAWLRAGWFFVAWAEVLFGERKDRWGIQYASEKGAR